MLIRKSRDIWVTFERKGLHCYPNAPEEVSYLRSPHRHIFKFRVTITTFHDDREIEFHMFQSQLENFYDSGVLQLDHKSCEMLADELVSKLLALYPNRRISVDVSEDGECGATITSEVAAI